MELEVNEEFRNICTQILAEQKKHPNSGLPKKVTMSFRHNRSRVVMTPLRKRFASVSMTSKDATFGFNSRSTKSERWPKD